MSMHVCSPYCTPVLNVHAWTMRATPGCTKAQVIEASYYFNGGMAEVIDVRRCEAAKPHPHDKAFTDKGVPLPPGEIKDGPQEAWLFFLWFPPWNRPGDQERP